ncbi:RNA polymerase sigma factor [Niallia sp. JL1B1071]|uniref:RNA polymerase sigma factor n=1 Tax=Niallia tiangongensis TaxID=3237105 RepID=UPI0037DDCFBD
MENEKDKIILEWYEKFGDAIFKYILIMIQDYQQAEDLTNETFFKAFLHLDTFKGQSSEKTWLYRIAHNLTVDMIRKKKPLLLLKEAFLLKKDDCPLPDEILQMKEQSLDLYHALSSLKKSYREVIILRKLKEFSIEETAEILGWSEGKVKSTLFRAIRALEKELKKEGTLNGKVI